MADGAWLGILRWSLAQSDGTAPSTVQPMSEETRTWLTGALESLTVNEAKRMGELAKALSAADAAEGAAGALEALPPPGAVGSPLLVECTAPVPPAPASVKLAALSELQDLVESAHNAKDLFVVGGFGPLLACLASPVVAVRAAAAGVVSTVVQNNPKAQSWALDDGALPALAAALAAAEAVGGGTCEAGCDAAAAAAATGARSGLVTALSSLVRDCARGQRVLLVSAALDSLLQPLLEWAAADGDGGAAWRGAGVGAAAPRAVRAAAARLVRKSLFAVSHLLRGACAEALAARMLLRGTRAAASGSGAPADVARCGLARALVVVATGGGGGAASPVAAIAQLLQQSPAEAAAAARSAAGALAAASAALPDARDLRVLSLEVLRLLSTEITQAPGVEDDGDDRRRGVTGGLAVGGGGAAAAARRGVPSAGVATPTLTAAAAAADAEQPEALHAAAQQQTSLARPLTPRSGALMLVAAPPAGRLPDAALPLARRRALLADEAVGLVPALRSHALACAAAVVAARAAAAAAAPASADAEAALADGDAFTEEAAAARAVTVNLQVGQADGGVR